MVADNKQPNPKTEAPLAKVGNGGTSSPKFSMRGIRFNREKLLQLLLIIVILIGAWMILHSVFHVGQKIYAQAAGHKIYKSDIENLIGNTKGVSDRQAATVLANQYLTQAMAKDQGITISDQDISAAYGPNITKQKTSNKYAYQNKVNQLYFNKLAAYNQGIYKGNLLVAHFSRNIPYDSPLLAEQKANDPSIGNQADVAADKKYAQKFITNLYDQLQAGKITWSQAVQAEHNDPVVGEKAYASLSHSGAFDTSSTSVQRNGLLGAASIRQQISNIKPGQTSKPFAVRVSNSINPKSKATAESYFLIVKMDSSAGGHSNVNFEQELDQAKQQLGYKVYV